MNINKAAFSNREELTTMSDEELKDVASTCRRQAKYERSMGDDQGVCQRVRELRRQAVRADEFRIARHKTVEELQAIADRHLESQKRQWAKAAKISADKRKAKEAALKTITPMQEAINEVVTLQYLIRESRRYSGGGERGRDNRIEKRDKISALKNTWGIKSCDIRRQTKYDPKYDANLTKGTL